MAKGFKHGAGGGNPLNFKVVGNPQPNNPKENTIWIDTDVPITGWQFSAEYIGKNLLPRATDDEYSGVKFVVNPDGSVTANGTATGDAAFFGRTGYKFTAKANTSYILSGCPQNSLGVFLAIIGGAEDHGNGTTFSYTKDTTVDIRIAIPAGVTVTNMTFYPMIRLASESDGTYVPYGVAPEGMVWIKIGTSGAAKFNVLKKNGIEVYPLFVKQSVSGAMVKKTAKIHQNSKWNDLVSLLYSHGDTILDVTGGWRGNSKDGNLVANFGTDAISFKVVSGVGSSKIATAYTVNKIDVTNYTKCKAKIKIDSKIVSGNAWFYFWLHDSPTGDTWQNFVAGVFHNDVSVPLQETMEIDLTNVTGSHYIGFTCGNYNAYIYEVTLE